MEIFSGDLNINLNKAIEATDKNDYQNEYRSNYIEDFCESKLNTILKIGSELMKAVLFSKNLEAYSQFINVCNLFFQISYLFPDSMSNIFEIRGLRHNS